MANSTSTTGAAVIEKRISTIVTQALIQNSVMLRAVMDRSNEVGPGMDRLDIPLMNLLAIQDVSETAAVTAQTIQPTVAQLTLNRHKSVPFFISDRLSVQSKIAIVTEAVNNGSLQMSAEIDDYLLGLIAANASAAAPDHIHALTADALADLALAKRLLDDAKVPMQDRSVVAAPAFIQTLLGNSNVINVDKYGSENPIQAGFVTRIYGFNLLESPSTSIEDGGFVAFHKSAISFARQLQPSLKSEYKVLEHGFAYSLSHLYGAIANDAAGTRVVQFNAAGA